MRFIGPDTAHNRAFYSAHSCSFLPYRIFAVADTAGTITYEDYSYGFDETDPTAVKKLSDDWTTFPGGQPWQRQAQSPCRYCNPTENAEDWFLKPGYVYKGGGAPVDACVRVLPFNMPANIPKPMAYYFMDEGHGRNLKESVTQVSDAGQVLFVDAAELGEDVSTSRVSHSHQHNLTGPNEPNWVHDDYFGRTIACGKIGEYSHQKDFIALADVDYGANGKWAMSVWYRHEPEVNFQGYQREQVS